MAEKEKKNSTARIQANNRYNKKAYDRINIAIPKGRKADIEKCAAELGLSLNGYLTHIIRCYFYIYEKTHDEEWRGAEPLSLCSIFDHFIQHPDSPGDEP